MALYSIVSSRLRILFLYLLLGLHFINFALFRSADRHLEKTNGEGWEWAWIDVIPHVSYSPQVMPHAILQTHYTFYPHRIVLGGTVIFCSRKVHNFTTFGWNHCWMAPNATDRLVCLHVSDRVLHNHLTSRVSLVKSSCHALFMLRHMSNLHSMTRRE